jgi:3-dehydroquinate dehydratase-2
MKKIMIINGPNLNMLGQRQPEIYGADTLEGINRTLSILSQRLHLELDFFQSNSEGALVDTIQKLDREGFSGAVLNAGAYTHTSLAIRDAVLSVKAPVVEVHLTNPAARESYRHFSYLSGAAVGSIAGFGGRSYELALIWFFASPQQ